MKTIPQRFTGEPVILHSNKKLSAWRQDIGWAAIEARQKSGLQIWSRDVPLALTVVCYFQKPKSAKKSKLYPTGARNDADKLLRAIGDGLASVLFENDGQIIEVHLSKRYGIPERAEITVGQIE